MHFRHSMFQGKGIQKYQNLETHMSKYNTGWQVRMKGGRPVIASNYPLLLIARRRLAVT